MALIKTIRGFTPDIGENCYLADNATIIGDVVIGNECSIWFNVVIRGDVNSIRIGNKVNIPREIASLSSYHANFNLLASTCRLSADR